MLGQRGEIASFLEIGTGSEAEKEGNHFKKGIGFTKESQMGRTIRAFGLQINHSFIDLCHPL